MGAKRAVVSIRAEEGPEAIYRLGLAVDSLSVDPALATAAGLGATVEAVALDATVTLSAPLDRHAGQSLPALRALDLTEAAVKSRLFRARKSVRAAADALAG